MLGVGLTTQERKKCPPRHVIRCSASARLLHGREYARGSAKRLGKKLGRGFKYVRARRIVCGQVAPRPPRAFPLVWRSSREASKTASAAARRGIVFPGPPGDVDTSDANEGGEPGRGSALSGVRAGRSGSAVGAAATAASSVGFVGTSVAAPPTAIAAAQPAAGAAARSTTSAALSVAGPAVSAAPVFAITSCHRAWLRGAEWSVLP